MERPRVLVACVGNIFLGDDAFGVEVAKRLALRPRPDEVRVTDFGIRGFDLALALLDDFEAVILVDATRRGGRPGTLYLLEHEMSEAFASADPLPTVDTHSMDPLKVLRLVEALGGRVRRLLVVGCEPAEISTEQEMEMGLSDPVRAVLDEAVSLIQSVVERILRGEPVTQAHSNS
jgi:hydrogenase maturation protease